MSIRNKLIFISAIFLIVPMIILTTISYFTAKENLSNLGMINLQNNVRSGIQLISVLDEEVKKGKLSLQEAQEIAKVNIAGEKGDNGLRVNKTLNLGSYGNMFILDKNGKSIADTVVELEGQSFWDAKDSDGKYFTRDIINNANNGGGYTRFFWQLPDKKETKEKIAYSEMDPNWGWVIISGNFLMEFDSGADHVKKAANITMVLTFIIGIAIIVLFAKSLSKPMEDLARQAKRVAEGDLSFNPIVYSNRKDEIGELSRDFEQMVGSVKTLIKNISNNAEQVAASSEELASSVEQTGSATEHIASTIEQVATGAEHQVSSIQEITSIVQEISNTLTIVANNTQTVNVSTNDSLEKATSGNEAISTVKNQMNSIDQHVQSLSSSIQSLGYRSKEIGEIIEVITGIAAQTNLLSLNAAIEAARAGENGRGFAVVADEVRKLAAQSSESAQKVGELISMIQKETDHAVTSMDAVTIDVNQGIYVVEQAGQSFDQIQESIHGVAEQIEQVTASIQEMNVGAEQTVASVQRISQLVQETSSSTQTVSVDVEEQTATMEEITTAIASLSTMALQLKEMIRKFKI